MASAKMERKRILKREIQVFTAAENMCMTFSEINQILQ
jgi:hypothetical protein